MSVPLDSSRLQIQHAAGIRGPACDELLPHFFHILRVYLVVETRPGPLVLRVVEDRRDRVGRVDDAAGVAADHEEEAVGRLQDQMLKLLVREERWFVSAVRVRVAGTCETIGPCA